MAQTLIAVFVMLIVLGGTRQADTCCPSVAVRITRTGDDHRFVFTNKAEKNVVAFTFKWDSGQYTTLLFSSPFRDTYTESAYLQWKQGDSPVKLASVAFDDGSFEGEAESAQWNLAVIRSAEDTHRKLKPLLESVIAGEVSVETALHMLEPEPPNNARIVRVTDRNDIPKDQGRDQAESLYRMALSDDKQNLREHLKILEKRFSMMRREAR